MTGFDPVELGRGRARSTRTLHRIATATLLLLSPSLAIARTIVVAPLPAPIPTVQAGILAALPGDTILVRAGLYRESITFPISGSAALGYITLRGEPGATLDGTGAGSNGIRISSRNYIRVVGMEIQNFKGSGTRIGISVDGSSSHLVIRNNLVHHIENPTGNAHGIAFYGTSSTPISDILVDGNEIRNCKLGSSESLVLNGNVTDFTVSNNLIHDNDNIGIDFIGFEGTGPAGSDQARNGICVGNTVFNISSLNNPAYGGERSADGIYVDGGRGIVIEKNRVYNCDIGIELASEHQGKSTEDITVRSNFVSGSYQANIMAGGYASNKGNAVNLRIVNNTTWQGTSGEVALQYNCNGVLIGNNIFRARSSQAYLQNWGGNNRSITVRNNLYHGQSASSPGDWSDTNPTFADPRLVNPAALDLHVGVNSPAIDSGADLGADGAGNPVSGVVDIDGEARVTSGSIDLGADEFGPGTTSVGGGERLNAVRAFPNPSRAGFRITTAETISRVSVFDVFGRSVLERRDVGAGQFTVGERLAPGVYFVVLEGEGGSRGSAKLVKLE